MIFFCILWYYSSHFYFDFTLQIFTQNTILILQPMPFLYLFSSTNSYFSVIRTKQNTLQLFRESDIFAQIIKKLKLSQRVDRKYDINDFSNTHFHSQNIQSVCVQQCFSRSASTSFFSFLFNILRKYFFFRSIFLKFLYPLLQVRFN